MTMLAWGTLPGLQAEPDPGRGVAITLRDPTGTQIGAYEGSYALLIGASDYSAGWSDLKCVPSEIDDLEKAVKQHGFQVDKVLNPDGRKLKAAFEDFIGRYGYKRGNRLFLFFSGHGHSRDHGKKGYLVPCDAPDPRKDELGFLRKALTMTDILAWSKKMEAKHALFLFDSCFSGTIFKSKAFPDLPPHISAVTAKPVRQYITAGDAGEMVPAKSVFAPCLVKALRGKADLTRDGYVTGSELGLYLREEVMRYKTGQTPNYGKILDTDLNEGDFVFVTGKPQMDTENGDPHFLGLLSLSSTPEGAAIYVEGEARPRGATPTTLTLNLGGEARREKRITLRLAGYEAASFDVMVERGRRAVVASVELVRAPSKSPWKVDTEWPFDEADARRRQRQTAEALDLQAEMAIDIDRHLKMTFVLLPAGEFLMGSENGSDDEKPVHRVRISKPFYLGKYEVTQEQWKAVMGKNPSLRFEGNEIPVHNVSWHASEEFLEKFNKRVRATSVQRASSGRAPRLSFSLPTEAQWEYACRSGANTEYCFGDDASKLDEYAWHDGSQGVRKTVTKREGLIFTKTVQEQRVVHQIRSVGRKKPNAWGLYDMHGNVWEWCHDWYDESHYSASTKVDPVGPVKAVRRVLRGGAWDLPARVCRSAYRRRSYPNDGTGGLRISASLTSDR